ncbi:small subunit ribosomal protein S8e, cytoplasmic [Guillardia theta CCMP2712]|uniref:40S ribosomal protein S8 n=1 Tax=Guillardia theta (strain CCMP2712) TaxID=905079 RepID=L1J4P7_GUITC|nr:small subunit ribosomal protein S8e, cytoplasmic [Guillardia theta CCMP2712]EKX43481.1 small subunit ribosomal protein S8e, cytoplasmic [Guillardia theta CCMP2712]|eukprot:XP_005830461.1 small subunit ribosomal protein S8e, cytoplasmic [Guillardia theta CCMP2712]
MGITRNSYKKRRATGGKQPQYRKKRKFELGRAAAGTRIGPKRIRLVRVRGGHQKHRALRLEHGNFSWGSEAISRKCRVLDVVYNASNNELVRTKTLVKNAIIQIDATPFRQWYVQHYGGELGKKADQETKVSNKVLKKREANRKSGGAMDPAVQDQFKTGRLFACVASRPGQSGRCDGYILEGAELAFYQKKMQKKKGKGKE